MARSTSPAVLTNSINASLSAGPVSEGLLDRMVMTPDSLHTRPARDKSADHVTETSRAARPPHHPKAKRPISRSEEHTSELQSQMRISYAVFCLKKKNTHTK